MLSCGCTPSWKAKTSTPLALQAATGNVEIPNIDYEGGSVKKPPAWLTGPTTQGLGALNSYTRGSYRNRLRGRAAGEKPASMGGNHLQCLLPCTSIRMELNSVRQDRLWRLQGRRVSLIAKG